MKYPEFFDRVETIILQDELSLFLGTFEEGKVTFSYLDVVKMAGHSCPTVAGAYLITKEGLKILFTDCLPKRGAIKLRIKGRKEEGVNGVIASVIGGIIGATDEGGFKGINGKFSRNLLISFEDSLDSMVELQRVDTGEKVAIDYNHSVVMSNPKIIELMQKMTQGKCDKKEKEEFGKLWQEKVCEILINNEKHEGLLTLIKK